MARYSESSPASLTWNPLFWFKQKGFFLIIFVAILLFIPLWRFTYGEIETITLEQFKQFEPIILTVILNPIIHLLGILGILSSIKFLAEVRVNSDIVEEIEDRGNKYLHAIQEGQRERLELDKLQQKILPNNQTEPAPAMIRLFQRIIMEAKDRQFESSVSLVQPYQNESYEKILQLNYFQKLALRIGILGTFLGLILAIKDLADQGISGDITILIRTLFDDLYLAFSTSVAGLEVAILLGLLIALLQRKQKRYFQKMEDAVLTMLSLARNAINKDEFLAEFSQIYNLMNELSNKIYDYNQSVKTSVGSAEQKIAGLTAEIEQGLQQLSQMKGEFNGFLNNLTNTQQQFIDDMQSIYDVMSLKRIGDGLQRSIIEAGNNVSNRVEQTEETVEKQTEQIEQGLDRLTETYQEFSQFLDEIRQTQEQFIHELRNSYDATAINNVKQALNNNSSQMQKLARVIDKNANASLWTKLKRLF